MTLPLGLSDVAQAQVGSLGTFTASPIYDEQQTNEGNNLLNAVDATATGSNMSLSDFKNTVAAAYDIDRGGVIDFEKKVGGSQLGTAFTALFGDSQRALVVSRLNGGMDTGVNSEVISGHHYLGMTDTPSLFTLSFSLPLSTVAVTALSRGAGLDRAGVMTIKYDDQSMFQFPSETIGGVGDDTVFIHAAPAPRSIASISFASDGFVRWDDLGFIVRRTIYEPIVYEDYLAIRDNFGAMGATREQGDLTGDGKVDLRDFQVWKQNWEYFSELPSLGAIAAVPEPAALPLAGVALVALWRRRRGRSVNP